MSVIPPTPALMALHQALASKPFKRLTPEAARAQVAGHRAEAEAEFYRHPKFARIARRQKWKQRQIVAKVEQRMALMDALGTQIAASRENAANLLCAIVAEFTGTPHDGKVALPSGSTFGQRGRPRQTP